MQENTNASDALLAKIRIKRQEIAKYLAKIEPRNFRLINASIICGALAAALTAGPGIGGGDFINSVKNIVSFGIPIWQVLCLIATLLSVSAVIANGMLKVHDLTAKIAIARGCNSKLEGLEFMLEAGQIDVEQATPLYTQYLTEIAHV
ncbi:hypothetical protein ACFL6N_01010 [Thermodesulfobacteriota bacterium]